MSNYKTYTKEKWLYFALSIIAYFLPMVILTAVFLPTLKAATGFKIAIGLCVILINAIPFLTGVFRAFFAHFPMLNLLAIVFLMLAAFFTLEVFKTYVDKFLWIELGAAVGSIASCIFWAKYLKYSEYQKTMKATVKSGAFAMKEEKDD